jgi:hypothetical protein
VTVSTVSDFLDTLSGANEGENVLVEKEDCSWSEEVDSTSTTSNGLFAAGQEQGMEPANNLTLEYMGELVQSFLLSLYQNSLEDSVNGNQSSGPSTSCTGSSLTVPSMLNLAGEKRRMPGGRPPREELRRTQSSIRPEPAKLLDTGMIDRKPLRACSVDPPRKGASSKRCNSLASSPGRSSLTCSE